MVFSFPAAAIEHLAEPVDEGPDRTLGIGIFLLRPQGLNQNLRQDPLLPVGEEVFKELPQAVGPVGVVGEDLSPASDLKIAQGNNFKAPLVLHFRLPSPPGITRLTGNHIYRNIITIFRISASVCPIITYGRPGKKSLPRKMVFSLPDNLLSIITQRPRQIMTEFGKKVKRKNPSELLQGTSLFTGYF